MEGPIGLDLKSVKRALIGCLLTKLSKSKYLKDEWAKPRVR